MYTRFPRRPRRPQQYERVAEVFSIPPIYERIYSHLEPGDSVRLSKTCRSAREAFDAFCVRGYNINKLLTRYFDDPDAFRRLQAKTATLISGSSALQFLDRSFYPEADLDLYTPRQDILEVGEWILEEGYTYRPTETHPDFHDSAEDLKDDDTHDDYVKGTDYRTTGIVAVYEFRKGSSVVQLIAARHSPFHAIISFHSTCVMNFITYEAAYSMYPAATFDARMAVTNGDITDKELGALAKYRERGWTLTSDIRWHGKARMKKLFLTDKTRWVKDKYSWRVPLQPLNPPIEDRRFTPLSRPMTFDPAIANGWSFTERNQIHDTTGSFLVSKLLKYRYMFGNEELAGTIIKFLREQGIQEFRRLALLGVSSEDAPQSEHWIWWDAALEEVYEDHFADPVRKYSAHI